MVVYCLKFVLRGESPRDYADLLRSLKFPPSISICDIPECLASHVNNNVPGFFSPDDGRLFPLTEDNLAAAEEGALEKRLPWIHNEGVPSIVSTKLNSDTGLSVHPITRVTERYCLSDRFHERNSSQKRSLLRRVTLVPELNGIINTEAEEQLHSLIGRSNYCLDTMKPSNHVFMMRLKIHLHNAGINNAFREMIENTFRAQTGHSVETDVDNHGRLRLQREETRFIQKQQVDESSANLPSTSFSSSLLVDEEAPPEEEHLPPVEIQLPLSPIIPVSAAKKSKPNYNFSFKSTSKQTRSSSSLQQAKVRFGLP